MRRLARAAAVVLTLLIAPSASAGATGGAALPSSTGGTKVGQAAPEPAPVRRAGPILKAFGLSGARLRFRIDARDRRIRVRVDLKRLGSRRTVARIGLGARRTGRTQAVKLDTVRLAPGRYELGISARDRSGRRLRRARGVRATRALRLRRAPAPAPAPAGHRFPIAGPFGYGGAGARFGAPRSGHSHQGQDLTAASGTPIVAPWRGTVKTVAYQARGAGHYIVLRGAGENRDYVFMHLLSGSTRVHSGQRVRTGQRLGQVGSTGSSTGPHLHFEVWVGGWFSGGKPVDPLPLLRAWDATD